jgi:hypothetical protein
MLQNIIMEVVVAYFFSLFNQQSEYKVFYKLLG